MLPNQVNATAIPPPRGIGAEWELRSLGISRIEFLRARILVSQVRLNESASEAMRRIVNVKII
jgi:hypothetical protein